jgi:hypothetical protein
MKKISAAVLAILVGGLMVLPSPASAGPPTPIGVAEAKRHAKKFIHDYCNNHNCRGSRIRKCESKTPYRVDCLGIYGRGAKDVCTFKVSVQAVKDRQIRINIIRSSIKCEDG